MVTQLELDNIGMTTDPSYVDYLRKLLLERHSDEYSQEKINKAADYRKWRLENPDSPAWKFNEQEQAKVFGPVERIRFIPRWISPLLPESVDKTLLLITTKIAHFFGTAIESDLRVAYKAAGADPDKEMEKNPTLFGLVTIALVLIAVFVGITIILRFGRSG